MRLVLRGRHLRHDHDRPPSAWRRGAGMIMGTWSFHPWFSHDHEAVQYRASGSRMAGPKVVAVRPSSVTMPAASAPAPRAIPARPFDRTGADVAGGMGVRTILVPVIEGGMVTPAVRPGATGLWSGLPAAS